MMIDYEEIEQYLNGEMNGEAILQFEEKMQNDNELAIEVELYQTIQKEGRIVENNASEKAALRNTLQLLNQKHFNAAPAINLPTFNTQQKPAATIISIKKVAMWVASVAAVFAIVFLVKNVGSNKIDSPALFAQYATTDDLNSERGDNITALQLQADSLFNIKNYGVAIPVLEHFLNNANENEFEYKMALGYSYMQTNAYAKADEILTPIANGTTLYANKAKWFKALLLLKQDKKYACIKQLEILPQTASMYKQAQELLGKLK